jgi:GNAT superfamily N-acetyltransferase
LPVLSYPKFRLGEPEGRDLLGDFLPLVETLSSIQASTDSPRCRDHNDQIFIHLALAAAADALIAGDGDLLALAAVRLDRLAQEAVALGFARCVRLSPGSEIAEFSITVIDEAQGQGIGSVLLDRIIGLARGLGIRRFRCEVLAENSGMRNLAQRLGVEPQWLGDGIVEYDCAPPETAAPAGSDIPRFLDPRGLVSPWARVWLKGLGDSLTLVQSSQPRVDRWLADLCLACAGEAVAV